jgi:hypothetical protein
VWSQENNSWPSLVSPGIQKQTPSFAGALRGLWGERIECMFGISAVHNNKFEFVLEALAPAAQTIKKSAKVYKAIPTSIVWSRAPHMDGPVHSQYRIPKSRLVH